MPALYGSFLVIIFKTIHYVIMQILGLLCWFQEILESYSFRTSAAASANGNTYIMSAHVGMLLDSQNIDVGKLCEVCEWSIQSGAKFITIHDAKGE
jgi:hypothetical protein